MARVRLPEATKMVVANRLHNGEEADFLATEYGIAKSTVIDIGRKYKSKPKVKRKVSSPATGNSQKNPFEAENKGLREENQRLRNLLLDEILKNK
jgi:hypothetical protein